MKRETEEMRKRIRKEKKQKRMEGKRRAGSKGKVRKNNNMSFSFLDFPDLFLGARFESAFGNVFAERRREATHSQRKSSNYQKKKKSKKGNFLFVLHRKKSKKELNCQKRTNSQKKNEVKNKNFQIWTFCYSRWFLILEIDCFS